MTQQVDLKALKEAGISVIPYQKLLISRNHGRKSKTLHPNVHAGSARKSDSKILDDLNIQRINVLVVNFTHLRKLLVKMTLHLKKI